MDRSPEPPSPVASPADDITLVLPEPTQLIGPASPPPPRRSRLRLAALIAGIVIAGAGVAVALVLSQGDRDVSTVAEATTPSPSPSPTILAPAGLTAEAGAFSVELRWTQPLGGGTEIRGFNVYRDGVFTGFVTQANTTFTDEEVAPGKDYTYEVAALGSGLLSEKVSVPVKTTIPPLGQARLGGIYNVRLKDTFHSGFDTFSGGYTDGWRFRPRCATGSCDVVWINMNDRDLRARFTRKGRTYRGSDSGPFNVNCGSTTVVSTVTIELRVVRARAINGEWVATRLKGTMEQTEASQLGCVFSRATYALSLNRLG